MHAIEWVPATVTRPYAYHLTQKSSTTLPFSLSAVLAAWGLTSTIGRSHSDWSAGATLAQRRQGRHRPIAHS